MKRPLVAIGTLFLLFPLVLSAQDATACSELGTAPSVVVHDGDRIEGLTVWRGTTSAEARTPTWREISCVPAEAAPTTATADIPEDWGVPDLGLIESLLFQSEEVRSLRAPSVTTGEEPPTLVGARAARYAETRSPLGVRAVLIDPEEPDRPLHVIIERATPTFVAVVVESAAGTIDLSWARSLEEPTWQRVEAGV